MIGNSLRARVTINLDEPDAAVLERHAGALPTLFIVSEVVLARGANVDIAVDKASGTKCERCWRFVAAVRSEPDWAGLCDRCVDALAETVSS